MNRYSMRAVSLAFALFAAAFLSFPAHRANGTQFSRANSSHGVEQLEQVCLQSRAKASSSPSPTPSPPTA